MFFVSLIIFSIAIYLIYFKKYMVKTIIFCILIIGLGILLLSSFEYVKQYLIFLLIIYLGSIFVKLGIRFLWKIIKSIDYRRKFGACFLYIFLYALSLFLIVNMNSNVLVWDKFTLYLLF